MQACAPDGAPTMEEVGSDLLETIGIFVVAAAATTFVLRVARVPSIVSYLVAGLLVGPLFGWARVEPEAAALETVAQTGIVLLLFLVGLELGLERIRQVGRVAVVAGVGQVLFTAAGGFALSILLGFEWIEAFFIGAALTFSSTVVVVKLLDQKGEIGTVYGQIAVGIFLVQDLIVIVALTILSGLQQPAALAPGEVALGIARATGGMALLLGGAITVARYLFPRLLRFAASDPRTLVMGSLAWCLAYVLVAGALGLSLEIGAFVAGLALAQHPIAHELRRRLHPLMTFFVVIFFVSLGARMELGAAQEQWVEAAVLSLFVLVGNPVIFIWLVARSGYSERTSFLTGVTVAQISEFSFVFAAMGVSTGLVGPRILSLVGAIGVVTIALSAYLILYNGPLYERIARTGLLRIFRARGTGDEAPVVDRLRDHVVVVGMNELGRRLVRSLHARGARVLALDSDPRKLADLPGTVLVGDVDDPATLAEAGLRDARLAISALRIEATNKLFVHRCRAHGIPVAAYGFDRWMAAQLEEVGADRVIESRIASGDRLIEELERLLPGRR